MCGYYGKSGKFARIFHRRELISIGYTTAFVYYDFDAGEESVDLEFFMPEFGQSQQVSAPTISLGGYEVGNRFKDLTLEFSGNGLSVDTTYGVGYCAGEGDIWFIDGPFDGSDRVIEKDEKYIFSVFMRVVEGYGIDEITKDMFVMNGITPYDLSLTWDYNYECLSIILNYELPVFYDNQGGFHFDATHHWSEGENGDKIDLAPHADTNNDEKCDSCGYDMLSSGNDPGTTPGTNDHSNPDKKDGLDAGAIVGIVAGAIVLLGGGGFAIFWFVIEKKSAEDLLALVKSNTTVQSEATSKEETPKEENAEKQAEESNEE